MESVSILQIVSGFKPATDGMGDFARLLGDKLWRTHQIRSHFLVYKKPQTAFDAAEIAPNTISYPAEATPEACLAEATALTQQQGLRFALLHYGAYAYSKTGNPARFCQAMADVASQLNLLTFFHENYASGPPWNRAFWTKREQQHSLKLLQSASKTAFTSNEKFVRILSRTQPAGRPLIRVPIFSNMGEPQTLAPLSERKRQMIVFGQLPTRVRLYKARTALEDLCRLLRIESIVDVGSGGDDQIAASIAGVPVRRAGWLDEPQVSALMADSIAGVIGYWPDVWEKSGVIAAYEAHALLPILVPLTKRSLPKPAYVPYVEIKDLERLRGADGKVPDEKVQAIVNKSHEYYIANQSLDRCAQVIASCILS